MKNVSVHFTPLHLWLLTLVNLALIAVVLFFIAQENVQKIPENQSSVISKEEESKLDIESLNPYGQAVARAGLLNCAKPMNELGERLLVGQKVGAYRFPETHPDFGSMSLEVGTQAGPTLYMTFNMAQFPGGACQISYEAFSHWSDPCDKVAAGVYKDFKPTRTLMSKIAVLTHKENKNRKVFVMPVVNGCVAIEKEIVNTRG